MDFSERMLLLVETLAEEGNVSRAAYKLFISQPGLTKSLNLLESELGVKLFDRSAHPVRLTRAGRIYLEKSRAAQSLREEMLHEFSLLQSSGKDCLRIGLSNSRAATLLPRLLPLFNAEQPEVEIKVSDERYELFYDLIIKKRLDLAIGSVQGAEHPDVSRRFLRSEDWVLLTNDKAPYLRGVDLSANTPFNPVRISPSDVAGECVIVPNEPVLGSVTNILINFCKEKHIKITTLTATDITNAYFMAISGVGITFGNPYMINAIHLVSPQFNPAYCYIEGCRNHPVYFFWRNSYEHPEYIRSFEKALFDVIENCTDI